MEGLDVDGRIILKLIFKEWGGGNMDWIYLAQDMDRLQQYTFAFHTMRGISWLAENLSVSQELCLRWGGIFNSRC